MTNKDINTKANNPEELLDLVDENDNIIGEVIRHEANSDPSLIHREIGVIVVNKENKILLEKRSMYKKVGPGVWSIPAGHVEKGDDLLETAHRELVEEIGFDLDIEYLDKKLRRYPNETHFMNYYVGFCSDELYKNNLKIEPAEVEKVDFFSREDVDKMIKNGEKVNKNHFDIFESVWTKE